MKRFLLLLLCVFLLIPVALAESPLEEATETTSDVLPAPQSGTLLTSGTTTDNKREQQESGMDTPLYESTQQYMDILTENKLPCVYRGKQSSTSESVVSTFYGNNTTLNTVAVFSDTETDCVIYVLRFVNFEGKNPDLVSPLLDALNSEYRFAKFYSAPNETVSVTLDLLFPTGYAGEICYDGLRRLLNICDECYTALSGSISDLPALDDNPRVAVTPSIPKEPGETDETGSDSKTVGSDLSDVPGIDDITNETNVSDDDFYTPSNTPVPVATAKPNGRQVLMKVKIRSSGAVNVRKEPDQNSILLGIVSNGDVFDCVGQADNGWYEIVLSNGMTGFVSNKRVTELH